MGDGVLRLEIGPDRMTVDDLIVLEEREALTMRKMRDLVARFVVDGDGEPVDEETSRALVGRMTMNQLVAAMDEMGESFEALKDGAVSGEATGS